MAPLQNLHGSSLLRWLIAGDLSSSSDEPLHIAVHGVVNDEKEGVRERERLREREREREIERDRKRERD
jgi:hypothetical protein